MGNCRLSGLYKQSIIVFLSTLPVGGATCAPGYVLFKKTFISIHAPRGGSDFDSKEMASFIDDFYPRSPWGERHQGYRDGLAQGRKFLSTLPVGGATRQNEAYNEFCKISIHAPRGGSDRAGISITWTIKMISIHAPRGGSDVSVPLLLVGLMDFYPRSPWGERHFSITLFPPPLNISIHAPRGGSDSKHDNIPFIFATVYYAI